jgi:hypothetical protein
MSYNINKSDGTTLTVLEDGVANTTASSLTLVGQNFVGYGEILQENLVTLLENFAKNAAPSNQLTGQLWFDKTVNQLKLWNGSQWKTMASSSAGLSSPVTPSVGDYWFDTVTDQLKAWDGVKWLIIGPTYTRAQGSTLANAATIVDNLSSSHRVLKLETAGVTQVIFSPDLDFTPDSIVSGFATIKQGFNIASTIAGITYHGTAQNAIEFQNLTPADFLRSGQNETIDGNLLIDSDNGLWVGAGGKFRTTIDSLTGSVVLRTHTNNSGITLAGTVSGTQVNFITTDGSTGLLSVAGNPVGTLGIATKNYVDTAVESAVSVVRNDLAVNVSAINSTIGVLTSEINDVNTYAQNLNTTKAPVNSPAFVGAVTAPTVSVANQSSTVATTAFVHGVLPYGVILMWSGSPASVPENFALCDGSNGTPDLRNRFVVGAGDTFSYATTGGNNAPVLSTNSAGSHSHTGSTGSTVLTIAQMPAHNHRVKGNDRGFSASQLFAPGLFRDDAETFANDLTSIENTGGSQGHLHSISNDGSHNHTITLQPQLPLYYALCYIMKVV